jgi:hypothetical protein
MGRPYFGEIIHRNFMFAELQFSRMNEVVLEIQVL